ncbi:MAG: response regulator, partial [Nitrospinae bacterium]|nr:response regulator [Nitrospinota bacterium]
ITAIGKLQQNLLDTRSLKEKLIEITDEIVHIFNADFCRIWVIRDPNKYCEQGCVHVNLKKEGKYLCQDHSHCLHLIASSGRYTHTDGAHGHVPLGAYKIGRLIQEGHESFISQDVVNDPQVGDHEWARSLGLKSFVGYGLFNSDNSPIGVLALFHKKNLNSEDIAQLRGLAATTSQVIMSGFAEETILQAKMEAEKATAAKGEFLARMSHEIRTPMNAVIGLTHLALRTNLSPKQRDYLRKIHGSSQALLGIINDILDFSKIESGKLTMENIEFNLQEVLDNLVNILTVKAEEKGLEFLLSLDRKIPLKLMGDPLRLGQILINLTSNAIKFTEKGEVVVRVRLQKVKENSRSIHFSIRDSGIGISEEQKKVLFQSFSQADGSITRRFGGTGLGLAISKQLVELMKGKLEVKSTLDKGSTFSFEIDLGCVSDEEESEKTFIPESLKGKNVLIVDDNKSSRKILEAMLKDFSFSVVTAESGLEAIALVEERYKKNISPFDLILMDWKMPEMDGIETARQLKNDSRFPEAPSILMITAYGREEVMQAADDIRLDGLLSKPVGHSLLLNTIFEIFGFEESLASSFNGEFHLTSRSMQTIQGASVLLVEDNVINQQVAMELLEQAGLKVDLAENGQEGVEKACKNKYDLVLMDMQMPVMDGVEATRRIRERGLKDLPIVAMTANALETDRKRTMEAGMNAHLTKPINPEELEETLKQWIIMDGKRPLVSASTEEELLFPEVAGLDTKMGLRNVGGSRELYLKLLKMFAEENQDFTSLIQAKIDSNELDVAHRMAHSLKGSIISLGAKEISRVAEELELALKNNRKIEVERIVPDLGKSVETFCSELLKFFHKNADTSLTEEENREDSHPDIELSLDLLNKLNSLLELADSQAEKVAEELCSNLKGLDLDKELKELKDNIEDVEFEDAIELSKQIEEKLRRKRE